MIVLCAIIIVLSIIITWILLQDKKKFAAKHAAEVKAKAEADAILAKKMAAQKKKKARTENAVKSNEKLNTGNKSSVPRCEYSKVLSI